MPRVHEYDPKHLAFLQPLLIISLAAVRMPASRCATRRAMMPLLYVAMAVVVLNLSGLREYYRPEFQKENWPAVVKDIQPRFLPGDAIVFSPEVMGFPFSYYLPRDEDKERAAAMAMAGAPLNPEFMARFREQHPDAPPPELSENVQRVWLVECRNHFGNPSPTVYALLSEHNFNHVQDTRYPGHLGYVQWALFVRKAPARERAEP